MTSIIGMTMQEAATQYPGVVFEWNSHGEYYVAIQGGGSIGIAFPSAHRPYDSRRVRFVPADQIDEYLDRDGDFESN